MARNWIVLGDPTTSGGRVIAASNETDIGGIPVARVGDKATCPTLHKGVFSIVEGDASLIVDGWPVALHGCALACGCRVLSSRQAQVHVIEGGGTSRNGAGKAVAAPRANAANSS